MRFHVAPLTAIAAIAAIASRKVSTRAHVSSIRCVAPYSSASSG
jgi:hypothetical protein